MHPFGIIRRHLRLYVILNLAVYALFGLGIRYAEHDPQAHAAALDTVQYGFHSGIYHEVLTAYHDEHRVLYTVILICGVNLALGAFASITLPSCVVPFSGAALAALRMFRWGLVLGAEKGLNPYILGLVFLEGQGYILASFAALLQGMFVVRPGTFGFASRWQAFKQGLRVTGRLAPLIALTLFVAAVYETAIMKPGVISSFPVSPAVAGIREFDGRHVETRLSGSPVYYADSTLEQDAKVVGVLLEDVGYMRLGSRRQAAVSNDLGDLRVEVGLSRKDWDNPSVLKAFRSVIDRLAVAFPQRRAEVLAVDVDSTGARTEKEYR